jgi:hypothetical protein
MQNFKVSACCESSKFTWDQSGWLGEGFGQVKPTPNFVADEHKCSSCCGERTHVLVSHLINKLHNFEN